MGPPWGAFCQITLTSCYLSSATACKVLFRFSFVSLLQCLLRCSLSPPRALCDRYCLSVILSLRQSLCEQDYCKSNQPISPKLCYDWAYQELINFRWRSGPGYGFRITFPLPSSLRNREVFRDLLASLRRSPHRLIFTTLGEMTRRRQSIESTTFWDRSGRHPNPD